jgi:hypothetical protein
VNPVELLILAYDAFLETRGETAKRAAEALKSRVGDFSNVTRIFLAKLLAE